MKTKASVFGSGAAALASARAAAFVLLVLAAGVQPIAFGASGPEEPAKGGKLKVFLLIGNSNMRGLAHSAELPEELRRPQTNVLFNVGGKWTSLEPGGPSFGPEITFGRAMAKALRGERIAVVKFAIGGTSLFAWDRDWTADLARKTGNEKSGPLYEQLTERVADALKGRDAEIVGVFWMGCGRDCRYRESAELFERNFSALIRNLRKEWGAPDLPFIYGRDSLPPGRFKHVDIIRKAEEKIAKTVPHTEMVDTDDLTKLKDRVHFAVKATMTLGDRFAEAYLKMRPVRD